MTAEQDREKEALPIRCEICEGYGRCQPFVHPISCTNLKIDSDFIDTIERAGYQPEGVKLNFVWKANKGQYASGESLYLGRICVANYAYSLTKDAAYTGRVELPSLLQDKRRLLGNDAAELKTQIENTVKSWFTEADQRQLKGE